MKVSAKAKPVTPHTYHEHLYAMKAGTLREITKVRESRSSRLAQELALSDSPIYTRRV